MFFANLFVTILTIELISCSLYTPNPCPKIPETKNLDFKRVVGDWYVLVVSMSGLNEGDKCIHSTFKLLNDRTLEIKNSWIDANGKELSYFVNDTLKQNNPAEVETEIEVTVNGLWKPHKKNITIDGYLVDTDYTNYQVIYSCYQLDHFWVSEKVDSFVVLTKSRSFDSIRKLYPAFGKLSQLKVDVNSIRFIINDASCTN